MTKRLSWWRVGRSAAAVFLVAFIVVAWGGSAQAAKRRVGVSVAGPHASGVHDAVAGALKHHGFEATSADVSGESADAIAKAAKDGKLAAVIVGEVRDGGKRFKLRVYGSGGDLIGEGSWAEAGGVRKLEAAVERTLWARIGSSLSKARPPQGEKGEKAGKAETAEKAAPNAEGEEGAGAGEAEKAPEKGSTYSRSKESETSPSSEEAEAAPKKRKKKKAAEEEPEEAAAPGSAGTALDLAVGPRFVTRNFAWSPQVPALRGYSLGFAPSFGANIAWYPAAHVRGGWVSNLGVATSIEYTPGLVSQTSDGSRYPTTESDYWGGVRGRLIFGIAQVALTLGAGQHSFIFHSQGTSMRSNLADLPDVKYTYARVGLDLRLDLPSHLALMLGGGYRYVINGGKDNYLIQAPSYFPSSTFLAFDANIAVGYKVISMLEVRAGFDARIYQMTAGDNTYMVTGANDRYLALWGQLALLIDGYKAGEGGPAATAPAKSENKGGDEE
jgi:hypothetical protein